MDDQRERPRDGGARFLRPGNAETLGQDAELVMVGSSFRPRLFIVRLGERPLPAPGLGTTRVTEISSTQPIHGGMVSGRRSPAYDRVVERRRAVALARHFRETEGLSIAQIAGRLGRAEATVKAYLYDPTGEKARAVKARYQGVCRGCGAYTQPRNGKGDAYAYCKACHPGAIQRRWTRERVIGAMLEWRARYGQLPSSYDWSRTHACRRGGEALDRLRTGDWPSASVVTAVCGSWEAARAAAAK